MKDIEKLSSPIIDEKMVHHIAGLAKLAPDDDECCRLQKELGDIIGYFQRLERLDTTDVPPAYHPHQLENQMRGDQVRSSSDRGELLDLSSRQKDGCLVAPRTVE
jgi:aspartyl-tRNA(Asn)/glutamyl-tRNA(Gln) amidotransferase subunit C